MGGRRTCGRTTEGGGKSLEWGEGGLVVVREGGRVKVIE